MTPQEHERSLDLALDDLLGDGSDATPVDFDPKLMGLLPISRDVRSVLANTPPPPHGLRPGRSVFLTAAATPPTSKHSRFSLPAFGRTLSWLAPTVAVLLFALLLTSLFRDNIFPTAPGSSALPEFIPTQTQSPALTPRNSSPITAPPEERPTQKPTTTPPQTTLPAAEQDIPSGLTGRKSPTAPTSTNVNPTAEPPAQDPIDAAPPEPTPNPSPDTQPTPSSSTNTPNPSQTPTATLTTTPTLPATPIPPKPTTKPPAVTPPRVITPPASLTPHPIPVSKTLPPRPTATPPALTQTPNISTKTPQVIDYHPFYIR